MQVHIFNRLNIVSFCFGLEALAWTMKEVVLALLSVALAASLLASITSLFVMITRTNMCSNMTAARVGKSSACVMVILHQWCL